MYKFMRTIQLKRLLVVKIVLLHLVCTYQNQNQIVELKFPKYINYLTSYFQTCQGSTIILKKNWQLFLKLGHWNAKMSTKSVCEMIKFVEKTNENLKRTLFFTSTTHPLLCIFISHLDCWPTTIDLQWTNQQANNNVVHFII